MDVRLVMFREDGSKRVFPLTSGVTTIGRKEDCSIRIPLATVSRRHAEIYVDEDGVSLKDLGAANGTYLNHERIDEDDIEPGDQIMIGPVVFTVQVDGAPPDKEIVKIRSKVSSVEKGGRPGVATSENVLTADDEVDPIAALEALASSADQTAINPEDDED
jgi:pSer/pThr/pTyr-binding forkhead associated (FHA) protein